MPFIFWPFILSLLGIIVMILFKHLEIKSGKDGVLSYATKKLSPHAHRSRNIIFNYLGLVNRKNIFKCTVWLAHLVVIYWNKLISRIKEALMKYPHSKKLIEAVKGRHELAEKGDVSSFLKRIEKDKDM